MIAICIDFFTPIFDIRMTVKGLHIAKLIYIRIKE